MSFFHATASLERKSVLPAGTDLHHAVQQLLQDHEYFVSSGPHSVEWTRVDADEEARLAAQAEKEARPTQALCRQKGTAPTQTYRVTDVVHTLPAGLWDSRVESTYEMTNLENGVLVRIRSPMSVVMDTVWTVEEDRREGGGDETKDEEADKEKVGGQPRDGTTLALWERTTIYCPRLLMGTVKSLCESGWEEIHAKLISRLAEK